MSKKPATSKKSDAIRLEVDKAHAVNEAATAAIKVARDAYEAAPSDEAWAEVERVEAASRRPRADLLAAEKRLAAALESEAAEAAAKARTEGLARLDAIRVELRKGETALASHVAALVAAERAIAAGFASIGSVADLDGTLRTEATDIAARFGVELDLGPALTLARAKAAIAVADGRIMTPYCALPRAPSTPRERERFLLDLFGLSVGLSTDEGERVFPIVDRIAALVDGTYPARYRDACATLKASAAASLARTTAGAEQAPPAAKQISTDPPTREELAARAAAEARLPADLPC